MGENALFISLRTALISTFLVAGVGIYLAHKLLNKKGLIKNLIESIILLPLFMPPSLVGYFILISVGKRSFIGKMLEEVFNFSFIFSWQGGVIACFVVSLPIMYQAAKGTLSSLNKVYKEAARLDGANELQIFFKITLPICIHGILSGVVLTFGRAFGEFGATMMVTGNIPGKTQNIPMELYYAVESGEYAKANNIAFMVIIISTTLIFLHNMFLKNKDM